MLQGLFWTVVAFASMLSLSYLVVEHAGEEAARIERRRRETEEREARISEAKMDIMRLRKRAREALGLEP